MTECVPLRWEMLTDPMEIRAEGAVDFLRARSLAQARAREVCGEPMLLAWFDRGRGVFSPNITCCREDKPSWLTYAESRGGDIVVCVNGLDYVFIFREVKD